MLVKKLILALFLSVGICAVGVQTDVYASEPTVQEDGAAGNDGEIRKEYVDLSDSVIQEGGFPKAESTSRKSRSAVDSGKEKEVQKVLLEAWDSFAESCDLSSYGLEASELITIYFGTLNTYPRYFYVKSSISYSRDEAGIVEEIDIEYKSEAGQLLEGYDRVIANVVKNVDKSWSDMEKALYVNDYLARNCQYDAEAPNAHSSYGALVDKKAVCQGYALAFLELTRQLDVTCEMVTSKSVNHAWNMIKIGNSYYHVDVTWNDPLEDRLGRARHFYFMKSTEFFKSPPKDGSHYKENDWVVSGSVSASAASSVLYDSYFWNDIDVGFDYVGDSWYGFNGTDAICQYTWNGQAFSATAQVREIKEPWTTADGKLNYKKKYVGTGTYGGEYYYSDSTAIYKLDINTKERETVFQLTDAQMKTGRIYAINMTPSGDIQYLFSATPNESGTVYTVDPLTGEVKPNLYNIHFDGNGATGGSMKDMKLLTSGEVYSLNANQFVNGAQQFRGWNTKKDGTGAFYADGAAINYQASENGEMLTLYAQWGECPHAKTEIRNKKDADCKSEGYTGDTYCLNCEKEIAKGRPIEKGSHTVVIDERVEATCTKEGKTEGSHCSACGLTLSGRVELPPTGHSFGAWVTKKNPQVGVPGRQERVCSLCGETQEQEIAALKDTVVKVSSISITTPLSGKIAAGKKVTLKAVVSPSNATNKGVTWRSSNTKVAKVDQNGKVTVLKKSGGKKAVITAVAKDGSGAKGSVTIKSMKGVVKSVSISGKKKVKAGKSIKLKAKVKATKGANKAVIWSSSNPKVATVSKSGKVSAKPKMKGKKVKITALAADGSGKKKSITIKIQ